MPLPSARPTVAVVGAGFCGALVALHLERLGLTVILIDRAGRFGPGLAYGAARPLHLLNTPAGRMSAFVDDPDHFTRWARAQGHAVTGGSFLPRPVYGAYLEALLAAADHVRLSSARQMLADAAEGRVAGPEITCLTGQVVELAPDERGVQVRLADGVSLPVDRVVLCPGNPPPAPLDGVPSEVLADPRVIADPWSLDPARLPADAPVMLVGTGLTALDLALTLADAGHRGPIHAVSRRGLLPQPHRDSARPGAYPTPDVSRWPTTARGLLATLRAEVRAAAADGIDWREVIASLRSVTPALWRSLAPVEQSRFLRHLRPFWDSHRHRAAPATHRAIAALQAAGRFHVHAARLTHVAADASGLRVTLERGGLPRELLVGALVNCTGPASDLTRSDDPLLRGLLARRLARPDPLGLGLDTDERGRLIGAAGPDPRLWLAGPLRRARAYEATAVLELAGEVAELAEDLATQT